VGPDAAANPFLLLGAEGDRAFDAPALERELRAMWRAVPGTHGSLYRAALANLVVPLDPGDEGRLGPVLLDVTRRHPARLFRIERDPGVAPRPSGTRALRDGAGLRARATALCHLRPGGDGFVCSEQILLRWSDLSAPLVPSAVRSLLVGDLPVVLLDFLPGPPPVWIGALEEVADVVIVDSAAESRPERFPPVWRRRPGRCEGRIHDLAWARLTPWRELLAEAFDRPDTARALASIQEVTILHGGEEPPAGAWLLAGWLATRLGWRPRARAGTHVRFEGPKRSVTVAFEKDASAAPRTVARVRVRSGAPAPLDLAAEHRGHSPTARVETVLPTATAREAAFGYRELAACVVGEIHRHDPNRAFEVAASAAEEMIALWRKA
jgi:glucose-6-phosphate dehydrogenase assembly protein OpcA